VAILTLTEFTNYVGSEIVANQSDLDVSLSAATYAVQHHLHRTVAVAGASATARVFAPTCTARLWVDDISTTSGLVISDNGATVASTDYQLEPLNGLDYTGATVPYTTIRRLSSPWYLGPYPNAATVTVTAKWGWAAIPDDIVEATRVLAKDLAGLRDTRFGVAGWGDFGVVRMRDNPQVMSLLAPYVRWDRAGIA
jgi:hypothetical protein